MYKYIGTTGTGQFLSVQQYGNYVNQEETTKMKKFQSDCNHVHAIKRREDGGVLNGWSLQDVLLLTRHGDRGPMAHVRGINSVDCSGNRQNHNNVLLNKYKTFLTNSSAAGGQSGHYTWNKSGPFHNFPLLPAFPRSCLLGQLTYSGISQLLEVGDVMRQVYGHQLGLLAKPQSVVKSPVTNTSSQPPYPTDEIIIYSTRYRRTFQSAMALMFGFVPVERWSTLNIRESHSLAFCFSDCACPYADQLKDMLSREQSKELSHHPTISAVVQWIGTNLLQNPTPKMHPMEVRDAVLSLICHDASLPCRKNVYVDYRMDDQSSSVSTTEDSVDLINIDQEDNIINTNNGQRESNNHIVDPESDGPDGEIDGCVEASHVTALLSYTNWQGAKESKSQHAHQQGLLRAYGLMRSIVNFILKIISGDKIKFVFYSGHDRTMQFLIGALGLRTEQSYFIPYATRMAFEIYKSDNANGEYYFRLIYNGEDVTRNIYFCEGGKSLRISKDSRGNKADLCPVENIIRFIHDDYFASFNATNLKDACAIPNTV